MVTLTGGPMGGEQIDGDGWAPNTERVFGGLKYRRDYVDLAVFTGAA
jgi:hypothetical protein